MDNMKIEVRLDDLVRVCNILDSMRVSLDQIGSLSSTAGREWMHKASDEYFGTTKYSKDNNIGVYNEIADCWFMLIELIKKEIGRNKAMDLISEKNKRIKYFDRNEFIRQHKIHILHKKGCGKRRRGMIR